MTFRTPARLRFNGGPLDGRELTSHTGANMYRMPGGEYHLRSTEDAGGAATYDWQPDAPAHWHDPDRDRPKLIP